jgi:hypothetical protein
MAITQEQLNRILGKQSVVQRAFSENRPAVTNTPRNIVSGTYADLLKPLTNNLVGDIVLGDVQRGLNSASYGQPLTTGGSVQTGGFRPEYLALALGLTPMGKGAKVAKKTEFEVAQEIAQRNASLPVSEGGLGLPKSNTAMDRAKAMGFDTDVYHGTSKDIKKFSNKMSNRGYGTSVAEQAKNAEGYAQNGAIYPLLINKNTILDVTNPSQVEKLSKVTDEYLSNVKPYDNQTTFYPFTKENVFEGFKKPYSAYYAEQRLIPELAKKMGYTGTRALEDNMPQYKIYNPKDIRSRFAAFDPFRRNEADILAGVGVGVPTAGLLDEKKKPTKK